MSLFPAYSKSDTETPKENKEAVSKSEKKEGADDSSWLANASFAVEVSQIALPKEERKTTPVVKREEIEDEENSPEEKELKRTENKKHELSPKRKSSKHKRHKSHHKHKRVRHEDEDVKEEKNYFEDRVCEKAFLMVPTLSRPAVPLYSILRGCSIGDVRWRTESKKKKRQQRYYTHLHKYCDLNSEDGKEDEEASTSRIDQRVKNPEKEEITQTSVDNRLEEELSKRTGEYNKILTEQPSNVELWLKYARFQDMVWQFEKSFRRGGGARGARVTAERKLAILDKALQHNPESEALLKERILVAESVFPADVLSRQLEDLLEKQPSQLVLWQGFIGATQCSLALCTVPAVSKLYNQAMERLHRLRRGAPSSQTKPTEEKILALLYDYGLFLRQAGLWEQLWLLLRLYLELNLSKPEGKHFKVESTLAEQLLTETEEQILASSLPLSELWLRVERLREGAHWLPWSSDEDCEDPQRLVFSDDVSDFLHPITTPSLLPNLAALILMLLKVPLLPCRDTTLSVITPYNKSWSLDSVEMLLPTLFPTGTVDLDCGELLKDVMKLTVGPQYLDERLGQEHYLEFVVKVFRLCADCLPEPSRTAFCVWWLRFERLLVVLDRFELCKLPQTRKKKLKSVIKDFLKEERNRNSLLFYREYALIEWELGHRDGACKILETAISAQPGGLPIVSVLDEHEKSSLGSLYRTLCELYLHRSRSEDASVNRNKAIGLLIALALGKPLPRTDSASTLELGQWTAALDRYGHMETELRDTAGAEAMASVTEHLLPDFYVDWVACNAWLFFLVSSESSARAAVRDNINKATGCRREALYEVYVNIVHHRYLEAPGEYAVLRDVLQNAMKEFPNNLYFLATAAKLQGGVNGIVSPWWKLRQYFTEADSLMARVFLVLLARERYKQQEKLNAESHNFLQTAGPIVCDRSNLNLLSALFSQLEQQTLTKRCPLIWRLFLRFLYDHGAPGSCKTAFYRAVEECPWVKALYIDASRLVPEELPQVQDLIIEKELRLHVTPEELDILRSGLS